MHQTSRQPKLLSIIFTLMLFFLMANTPTHAAATKEFPNYVTDENLIGKGRYSYLFWDIYDASLYSPTPPWQKQQPFALSLSYLRTLDGHKIAERSLEEMENIGLPTSDKHTDWLNKMKAIFPNVSASDTLTGVRTESGHTEFYLNKKWIGHIKDPEFADWFFGIWLHPNTSAPMLRERLLNQ